MEGRVVRNVTPDAQAVGEGGREMQARGAGHAVWSVAGFADPGGHTDSSLCVTIGPGRT